MESDAELVGQVLAGRTECFRALVERYQDAVFGVALSKTQSRADAEDVAQEAFLAAYESLGDLQKPDRFGSWLYGIALNKARMHVRRNRQRDLPRPPEPAHAPPADERAVRQEMRDAVMAALGRLSEANRETATLFYINGYSHEDISQFTDRPVGTVKRRLHDARKQLRKELVGMVEEELKRSRPDRKFAERVLRTVGQVRVHVVGESGRLLLTDDRQRSLMMLIGSPEGDALQPWLDGKGSPDAGDLHTAMVRAIEALDARLERVVVVKLEHHTFIASAWLRSGRRSVEVDCRPSDAVNLAVRAGAALSVARSVFDRCVLNNADGKPMSPTAAWRLTRQPNWPPRRRLHSYPDIRAVLRQLSAEPNSHDAWRAAREAHPDYRCRPARVADTTNGMRQLDTWVKRCRGTKREALALSLLGDIWLYAARDPNAAIPHLEDARRLAPDSGALAFDLATAYAMVGRAHDAFAILSDRTLEVLDQPLTAVACKCGNFADLWDDARFSRLAGAPDRQWAPGLYEAQADTPCWRKPRTEKGSPEQFGQWRLALHSRSLSEGAERAKARTSLRLPALTKSRQRELAKLLGVDRLVPVLAVSRQAHKTGRKSAARCRTKAISTPSLAPLNAIEMALPGACTATLRPRKAHRPHIGTAFMAHWQRPMTPHTVCNVVESLGAEIEAVLVLRRTRGDVETAIVLRKGDRREVVKADGSAIAVAASAGRPLLLSGTLAERLQT